jgi:hypothetical protein
MRSILSVVHIRAMIPMEASIANLFHDDDTDRAFKKLRGREHY